MSSNNFFKPDDVDSAVYIGRIEHDSSELVADCDGYTVSQSVPLQRGLPRVELAEDILKRDEERRSYILALLRRGGVCPEASLLDGLETMMTHNCYVQVGSNKKMLRIHPSELELRLGLFSQDNDGLDIMAIVCFKE